MFFDTHAHLNIDPFYNNAGPYIQRALEAGVTKIIVPAIDIKTSERAIDLADKFDGVYSAVGVHPHDCVEAPKNYLNILEDMLTHPKVVAVGEIGLDYFRDYAPEDAQKKTFREQIELAKDKHYPMIVHNRSADDDTFNILEQADYFNAQFHCYALISFTGVVTFAKTVKELLKTLPLGKLMIETDCPWMAPVPHRGKQNEPAYVIEVAKTYGHIFGMSLEEIGKITTTTAKEFFKIA
jgi:TatD DNase family protein